MDNIKKATRKNQIHLKLQVRRQSGSTIITQNQQ